MIAKSVISKVKQGLKRKSLRKTVRYAILGKEINEGLVFKAVLYTIFICTSYIYLNPVLRMLVKMVMNSKDLIDPTVTWIPNSIYLGHIKTAWQLLQYNQSFMISITVTLIVSLFHCFSCSFAGYAFARMVFPFKRFIFFLVLLTFIIPPQVIILPSIIAYNQFGLTNSLVTLVIPSIFGFGIKGALFVIIYRQFFITQPKELEEAAKIDGASAIRFFFKVMLPLAKPAILVVFLFSFVWTWNDTYFPTMFLSGAKTVPLSIQMSRLDGSLSEFIKTSGLPLYSVESIRMAASFLVILPPLLIYLFAQRYFVESVERTGLVE